MSITVKIDEKSSKPKEEVKIDGKSSLLSPLPHPKVVVVNEKTPLLPSSPETKASALAPSPEDNIIACAACSILCCIIVPLLVILSACAANTSPQEFYWPSVKVDSLSVEDFNVSVPNSQISANWNVSFMFTNPYSSARLIFRELDAAIFYGSEFLGGAFINPFLQQPSEENKLVPVAVTASPTVVAEDITKAIDADMSRTGVVEFNVRMHGYVRLDGKGPLWLLGGSGEYEMLVTCGWLEVQFCSSTSGTSGKSLAHECSFFWEKNL